MASPNDTSINLEALQDEYNNLIAKIDQVNATHADDRRRLDYDHDQQIKDLDHWRQKHLGTMPERMKEIVKAAMITLATRS